MGRHIFLLLSCSLNLMIIFGSLPILFTVVAQRTTVENGTKLPTTGMPKPNYAFCHKFAPNKQKACRIMVHNLYETRKAENEGRIAKEDDLLPPTIKINGLSPRPVPAGPHLSHASGLWDAQPPPPKVQAEKLACLNLTCFCSYLEGGVSTAPNQCTLNGQSYGKAIRMEYRMLSDKQRNRFHSALMKLKCLYNGTSEYDRLAYLHYDINKMPSAHGGPTFPLWHREYLKRLEFGLRSIDPSVALPYWDSTLDQALSNPADSIIWSDKFMGSKNEQGSVVDGFLANWITPDNGPVERRLGLRNGQGSLLTAHEVNKLIHSSQLDEILAFTTDRGQNGECELFKQSDDMEVLEINHNNVHIWIGGHMENVGTAPYDPIFFLHHSFIDYIWEQWRMVNQHSFSDRETAFLPEHKIKACSAGTSYLLDTQMVPFVDPPLDNRVGLSNDYTTYLYHYHLSPTCRASGGCGSPYLFCDTITGPAHCCAKIKLGGNCAKFSGNGEQPCYESTCVSGICRQKQQQNVEAINTKMRISSQQLPVVPKERVCYDNHECCAYWASINNTCKTAHRFMNVWCPGICHFDGCHPLLLMDEGQASTKTAVPTDMLVQCKRWATYPEHMLHRNGTTAINECQRNRHWMAQNCPEACEKITDKHRSLEDMCSKIMPNDPKLPSLDNEDE